MSLRNAKVTEVTTLYEPKWVKTNLIRYTDPNGQPRDWEFCSRRTRCTGSDCDGVGVLAILRKESGPEIVLQKQFRPPVDGICIEIPAGLLDPNETPEQCALRELHEETGYYGRVIKTSPLMFNDPGFCNTNLRIVHVEIDLSDSRNLNPEPQLEENEFIEVFSVPVQGLSATLAQLESEGYRLDARIQNIADGIELVRSLGLMLQDKA